jgi:hypothetical protein
MNKLARLTVTGVVLSLTGCVSTSPDWDARFGEAARVIAAQQVIAPEASRNADPVTGIDGKAAQGAIEEYAKSFTNPEPPVNVFTIGVGSGQ